MGSNPTPGTIDSNGFPRPFCNPTAATSKGLDRGFDDDFLNDFGEQLSPDSSAIAAKVDLVDFDVALDVLDQLEGGTILHTMIRPEVAATLSEGAED